MGFAPDWLALRAPADNAARDPALLAQAGTLARGRIVDLGAGTGATLRAMAQVVPDETAWTLVDNDAGLLARAPRMAGQVQTVQADLTDLGALPLAGAGLVTASALLDLVSEAWLVALVARLAEHKLPFYAALSYDGQMSWSPTHAADDSVTRAFNRDQCSDKGFGGPALGPTAAMRARDLLARVGYDVTLACSPWRLGPEDAALQTELLSGIAAAATRAGNDMARPWQSARIAALPSARACIGHLDLLARPPETSAAIGKDSA